MLGSDLIRYFRENFQITAIHKENYNAHVGKSFDVLINANGNSKRFWANQHPQDDFIASTVSVYRSIFDFSCGMYIYISSPDVYENHTSSKHTKEDKKNNPKNLQPYGFHKYLAELIVKEYKEKFLILRVSMMLGTSIKKGPFYDVINENPIFVTLQSRLQLITTHAVAQIIKTLLEKSVSNETLNVGGIGSFAFKKIKKYFDKEIRTVSNAETQKYEMNTEKVKYLYSALKISEEYLKEFLQG